MHKTHQELHILNKKASIAWAETALDQFICDYKLPNISNRESFKEDLILNMKNQYSKFVEDFLATQTGHGALEKCLQTLPGFMIQSFDDLYKRLLDIFDETKKDLEEDMKNETSNKMHLKSYSENQEKDLAKLQKENTILSNQIEKLKAENSRITKAKGNESETSNETI